MQSNYHYCYQSLSSFFCATTYPRFLMAFSSSFSKIVFSLSCWDTNLSTWVQWAFCIVFWSWWKHKMCHLSIYSYSDIAVFNLSPKTDFETIAKQAATILLWSFQNFTCCRCLHLIMSQQSSFFSQQLGGLNTAIINQPLWRPAALIIFVVSWSKEQQL